MDAEKNVDGMEETTLSEEVPVKPKKKKSGTPNKEQEALYPPREGYTLFTYRGQWNMHIGYLTQEARVCRCGSLPVLEQYVGDVVQGDGQTVVRNVPARVFVAICPKCERRARGHGSLKAVLASWNSGQITRDSRMVNGPLESLSLNGYERLSNRVVEDAIEEAVALVKEKNRLMDILNNPLCSDFHRELNYTNLRVVRAKMREVEKFFRTSPLMLNKDADAILSGIRRILHPDLTPEERLKIPLKLYYM